MKITINKLLWGFALLLLGLAYCFGLFIDLTGDSGLYAAISRQMVESGDWLNLKINGTPYDQKPHLLFWLAGAGIKLFGNTNFAFKLFPFLYGILGFYFTYRLGKTIYLKEAGKLAALVIASSQISFLYFFDFHTDSVLQTGVVLALWQLAEYLKFKKAANFVWAFVGVGLAMFSKGPIGAVIPFFAVLFYLISARDFKQLFHLKWLAGIFIAFLIISPSLFHLYKSFGMEGIKFFFITNNFGRITGELAGSNNDPFFYLHTLLWAFLPWTVFVVLALISDVKSWFNKNYIDSWSYFLLGGVFVLLVILSIAKGKAPNYFLIAAVPIAVVCGKWMVSKVKKEKYILYPLFVIAGINLVSNTAVLPGLFEYQAARQVLEIFETEKKDGDQLYNFHREDYELFYWAKDSVIQVRSGKSYAEMLANTGTWLHTNKNGYEEFVRFGFKSDTVYFIRYKGMNKPDFEFLNPKTREASLDTTYLIRID